VDEVSVGVLAAGRADKRMAELYETHAPGAYRLAYLLTNNRHAAEDIVQDAFVRLFGRFRDLRDPTAFPAYLRKTVVNLCRDRFRRTRSDEDRVARVADDRQPVVELGDVERQHMIVAAIRTLPRRQQIALVLRYYEDLSEQQAADTLGCSRSALKALVLRATNTLRDRLKGEPWT
jgi:RNA polymerase sigma-70 factor (sigma-E family)